MFVGYLVRARSFFGVKVLYFGFNFVFCDRWEGRGVEDVVEVCNVVCNHLDFVWVASWGVVLTVNVPANVSALA